MASDRRQHPQAVRVLAQVMQVERQHHQADEHLGGDGKVAGRDVAGDGRQRPPIVGRPLCRRGRRLARGRPRRGVGHAAPFPNSTTLTVSKTMVRSKMTDRCLM